MQVRMQDHIVRVDMPEKVYVEEATMLREEVSKWLSGDIHKVEINFQNTGFIDSSGLGVIVTIHKRVMSKNGTLVIKNLQGSVKELFKMTRLNRVLTIEE